jgi:HSF-type DNA-binding
MLVAEKDGGIVEWRRGLLVLHSTDAFTKSILPKHFNTRNFKTFRRQVSGSCTRKMKNPWSRLVLKLTLYPRFLETAA